MSFYITLPSTASLNNFPYNNAGSFSVKLPQTIELSSQYEVGLAEIQFPNSYFNILEGDVWIQYLPPKEKSTTPIRFVLPAGYYKSTDEFIDALNLLILEKENGDDAIMRFFFREQTNKAFFKLYEKGAQVKISETLQDVLWLPTTDINDNNQFVDGTYEVELDTDKTKIFVYCDLISPRPVGDAMVPLLRTVPILDRLSASLYRIYDKPHYGPLSRFSFDTIEILLTTETGKPIPFVTGSSVLTLHFRKRKHFDFD